MGGYSEAKTRSARSAASPLAAHDAQDEPDAPPAMVADPPRRLGVLRAAPVTIGGWRETLSAVRLFSRPTDRLRYLGRLLLRPTLAEWSLIRLPSSLRFLYYGLRPLRLGLASSRAMVRAGLGRLHP